MINISYLNVPLEYDLDKKLKDNMILTGAISEKSKYYYPIQPKYKSIKIEWDNLHKMVASDYRQYSHFEFSKGHKIKENWRNDNQNILILDIDDGCTINKAKEIFKEYKYFMCTTKSHQQDKKGVICDRFRIVLKSDNIPKGDLFFEFIREMELKYPFIDKQPNCKSGAFLGHANCEYWYNEGKLFDCKPLLELSQARKQIINIPKPKENINQDIDLELLKQSLSRECVADIIRSCGYEVNRQFKFKYRLEERTPSASITNEINPLIKDFGCDLSTDCIGFVMEVKNIDFKESIEYIKGFI